MIALWPGTYLWVLSCYSNGFVISTNHKSYYNLTVDPAETAIFERKLSPVSNAQTL